MDMQAGDTGTVDMVPSDVQAKPDVTESEVFSAASEFVNGFQSKPRVSTLKALTFAALQLCVSHQSSRRSLHDLGVGLVEQLCRMRDALGSATQGGWISCQQPV